MSISKQGIITTSEFSEIPVNPYDTTIYTEPDGSTWIRIVHHNNPASNLFVSTDDFEGYVYKNANLWFFASLCNFVVNGRWEFMIKQKTTSSATETKFRWIQYKNPYDAVYGDVDAADITKNSSAEYASSGTFGGIYKATNVKAFFTANDGSSSSNWWGAFGANTAYQGGIPGFAQVVITSGYFDLYIRVGNTASIYENGIGATEFIEM